MSKSSEKVSQVALRSQDASLLLNRSIANSKHQRTSRRMDW